MTNRNVSGQVEWPTGWLHMLGGQRKFKWQGAFLTVGLLVLGLLLLVAEPEIALVTLALVPFFVTLIVLAHVEGTLAMRRDNTVLSLDNGRGQFIPYSRGSRAARYAAAAVWIVVFGAVPWLVSRVPWDGNVWNWAGHLVGYTIAPAFSLYLVPFLLSYLIRGFKPMGLALTREGIVHSFWFCTCSYAWDGVATVAPGAGKQLSIELNANVHKPIPGLSTNWIGRTRVARERMRSIPVTRLAINPALAYRAVEFYHKHPEYRSELGTDAGTRRIREADFILKDSAAEE